jgi:uncharacterized protein (TIGR03067 family)
MSRHAALILAVALPLAAQAQEKDAAAEELKRLQGTWVLVGREFDGEKATPEEVKKQEIRVVVKGDKVTATSRGDPVGTEYTVKLDPKAKPRAAQLIHASGPMKGKTAAFSIYKLEGDRLTVCRSPSKRPAEFKTKPDSDRVVLVYQREKK